MELQKLNNIIEVETSSVATSSNNTQYTDSDSHSIASSVTSASSLSSSPKSIDFIDFNNRSPEARDARVANSLLSLDEDIPEDLDDSIKQLLKYHNAITTSLEHDDHYLEYKQQMATKRIAEKKLPISKASTITKFMDFDHDNYREYKKQMAIKRCNEKKLPTSKTGSIRQISTKSLLVWHNFDSRANPQIRHTTSIGETYSKNSSSQGTNPRTTLHRGLEQWTHNPYLDQGPKPDRSNSKFDSFEPARIAPERGGLNLPPKTTSLLPNHGSDESKVWPDSKRFNHGNIANTTLWALSEPQ